jgi:hypothetical protein
VEFLLLRTDALLWRRRRTTTLHVCIVSAVVVVVVVVAALMLSNQAADHRHSFLIIVNGSCSQLELGCGNMHTIEDWQQATGLAFDRTVRGKASLSERIQHTDSIR